MQEEHQFEASLGYIAGPCAKKKDFMEETFWETLKELLT
jgi:hypothetical protein